MFIRSVLPCLAVAEPEQLLAVAVVGLLLAFLMWCQDRLYQQLPLVLPQELHLLALF
jgi:hypothetical protein